MTHGFNQNQRINRLGFWQTQGGLNVTAPSSPNVAPPGYYMLFILNSHGVPSIAKIVRIDVTGSTPSLTSLAPTSTPAGGPAFTLTVNGSNFVGTSEVRWNGAARTTTFVNAGQVTAAIPASDIATQGSAQVTVVTPGPGGGISNGLTFVITPPAAENQAPTVNAGMDQTVTLPNGATLTGTVSDDGLPNGTLTRTWSKFSGPGTVTFGTPTANTTTATFSSAGTYVLRLTASDGALSSSDDVTVTVNTSSGPAVVSITLINADTDQPVAGFDPLPNGSTLNLATLPTRNLNLRANVTGTVGSVRFAFDANPNFRTENSSPFTLAGDSNGDYAAWTPALGQHTATATPYSMSNAGGPAGTAHQVQFTVVDNAGTNQAPTVNAGTDQTVTLPNSATLTGTVSDDGLPNGTLTRTWSKFSGPGTVTFGTPTANTTTATFSSAGTYVLRLTASDGALSSSDDVTVTVNTSGTNQAPTVSAGMDQTVTLPNGATLTGTVSDDGLPNGTLTRTWSKFSGPGTVTFGTPTANTTTATFSSAGTYVLRLTASDGALSSSDDVTVTVNTQLRPGCRQHYPDQRRY